MIERLQVGAEDAVRMMPEGQAQVEKSAQQAGLAAVSLQAIIDAVATSGT